MIILAHQNCYMTESRTVAGKLLEADAVKLDLQHPFTWASGWKSPIYCDNRRLLSFPYIRDFFKSELSARIFTDFPDAEAIAGVATAGIAWGTMVADQLKLPFLYVRPKPKEHGLGNQIEGRAEAGKKVVVVEDLISTGKSSLKVCDALRNAGMEVQGMVALFTYGFPQAEEAFVEAGVQLHALTSYQSLVEQALQLGQINEEQVNTLLKWRSDPAGWTGKE